MVTCQCGEETGARRIQKVLRRYKAETCYCWAIALKEDHSLIGFIDLLNFEKGGTCGFAYITFTVSRKKNGRDVEDFCGKLSFIALLRTVQCRMQSA